MSSQRCERPVYTVTDSPNAKDTGKGNHRRQLIIESPCNWIGRIIIKIPILHTTKLIYRFNAIPIKILILDLTGLEKNKARIPLDP